MNVAHLEVINESSMHNVPEGSETHFRVVVVSNLFEQKGMLERHRVLYDLLTKELKDNIHALALQTWTLEEWSQKKDKRDTSPLCLGGSKK